MNEYCIVLARPCAGLFAQFRRVLGLLPKIEETKDIPVAFFNHAFPYWAPGGYEGRKNGWEYYFKPLSESPSVPDLLGMTEEELQLFDPPDFSKIGPDAKKRGVRFSMSFWNPDVLGRSGKVTEAQRKTGSDLVRKYVRLQDSLEEKFNLARKSLFENRHVVGVQFRGTDKGGEIRYFGYSFANIDTYLKETDLYLDNHKDSYIFLATDLEKAHDAFKKRYGEKLLFREAHRSTSSCPLHKHGSPIIGEEAVLDALLLSSVNILICGMSNLTIASSYFNPNLFVKNVYDSDDFVLQPPPEPTFTGVGIRPPEGKKRIISFSLWGIDEDYNLGALENVVEAQEIYPGWICRFYVEDKSPILERLKALPCEVVVKSTEKSFRPGFWRFLAASDPDAEYVIFRDCDSRVNAKEAAAVEEWMSSGKALHVMKDTHAHKIPIILAGMWGIKGGIIQNISELMEKWLCQGNMDSKGGDQKFLADVVWPFVKDDALLHGKGFFSGPALPFPKHGKLKPGQHYIGQYIRPKRMVK